MEMESINFSFGNNSYMQCAYNSYINTPVVTVGENNTTNTFNNNFGSTSVVATPAVNNTVVGWTMNGNSSGGNSSDSGGMSGPA